MVDYSKIKLPDLPDVPMPSDPPDLTNPDYIMPSERQALDNQEIIDLLKKQADDAQKSEKRNFKLVAWTLAVCSLTLIATILGFFL